MARNYRLVKPVSVARTAHVCPGAIIGKAFRPLVGFDSLSEGTTRTIIHSGAYIGYNAVIGAGSEIGERAVIDDFSVIECDVSIASECLVIYRAQICNEAVIGRNCVIGGFVAERVVVGDSCRVFGQIVHSHRDPTLRWDDPAATEESAVIHDRSVIGFGAIVVGRVAIGPGSYVCAGAVVTRDVPPGHIAHGVNKVTTPAEWVGQLGNSPLFKAPKGTV